MKAEELKKLERRAKKRLKARKDPRFIRVIRAFEAAGLLITAGGATGRANPVTFDEINFAGEHEPRVFEVLPALVFRRPKAILNREDMPEDLKRVIYKMERNEIPEPYRGIEPQKYLFWVNHLRRTGAKDRTINKIFRFSPEDVENLRKLKLKWGAKTESEVIRRALQSLG